MWKSGVESSIELYRQEAGQRSALLEGRMTIIEKSVANNSALIDRNSALVERVKAVEVGLDGLKEQNQRIESKLDNALDRRR
jgi:hypothetical protein